MLMVGILGEVMALKVHWCKSGKLLGNKWRAECGQKRPKAYATRPSDDRITCVRCKRLALKVT